MATIKIKNRLVKDKAMLWTVCLFAALTAVPLFTILGEVLLRGYDQLTWSFFTEPTPTAFKAMKAIEAGEPIPGGIANGIIGTLIMLGMAAIFAIPTGILCGAYLAENSKSRFAQVVSYLTDLLQGTPSVIIGIVTYIWVVVPMKGYSAIAGSVALFVMMLPLIIRSTEETLKILPASLKEAGLALGGNRARVMLKVQLPAFQTKMQSVAASISEAQTANFDRWHTLTWHVSVGLICEGTWEKEVRYLETFFSDRITWLDTFFKTL